MKKRICLIISLLMFLGLSINTAHSDDGDKNQYKDKSQNYKLHKAKLLKSKPTKLEITNTNREIKKLIKPSATLGVDAEEDCWSFCDEVCSITPGGVCYCGAQSYSCDNGPPVSYPVKPLERETPTGN